MTFAARIVAMSAGLLAVLSAALLWAGCGGGDDDSSDAAQPSQVTVKADEYSFELSDTPGAETAKVTLENVGEEPHALIFARINEGFTLDEAFELQGRKGSAEVVAQAEVAPGKTVTEKVRGPLKPGSYAMVCPLRTKSGKSHFELGQREEFAIEG